MAKVFESAISRSLKNSVRMGVNSVFIKTLCSLVFAISLEPFIVMYQQYGNTGCGVLKRGGTKLERYLPKNQHTQRKLLNF